MPMTFETLQNEVKRRGTRDQSGTTFDTGIKNAINFALFRISRDAPWRSLRRKTAFDTVKSYKTGTYASLTSGSTIAVINSSATLITDGVIIGRKVKFGASGDYYFIETITSETSLTIDKTYYSSSNTATAYEILPQEEYALPIQAGHRMFMWHEQYGYPFLMKYVTDIEFFQHGVYLTDKGTPTHYRMWGEDMVNVQLRQPSILSVVSSSASDTSVPITIFGMVGGYPDYEIITVTGTGAVNGSKTFQSVERVTKSVTSVGRITVTGNSATDTVAVLPVGDTTSGPLYRKVQLYPLPDTVFPVHVQYYKYPFSLVNDGDVHELGGDFDEAIILLATAKIKAESNLAEADRFLIMWQDEMRSLKRTNVDKIDWFPSPRKPKQTSSDSLVVPNMLYRQAGSNFGPSSRF
jgi:hypothetical protein